MKIIKNYFYNVGYQLLILILPIITGPFVSRKLGAVGVGINSYTYSLADWFVLIGGLGISLYGSREIAYCGDNSRKLTVTFIELQVLKTFTIIISYSLFIVFLVKFKEYKKVLLLQSIYIIASLFDISWLYMGIENFKLITFRNTIIKIISVILILLLIRKPNDIYIYIMILSGSILIGNLTLWFGLGNILTNFKLQSIHPLKHIRGCISLFIPLVAVQLYVGLNKTMLGIFDSTNASGFYDKSDSIIKLVLTLVTSLSSVLLPYTATSFANGDFNKVKKLLYESFDFVSFIAIPMCFGIAGISIKFGPFFYGSQFKPVGYAMLVESILIVILSWSSITGNQYLVPTKQVRKYTFSIIIGSLVNILLNIPLITKFGLIGAVISTILAESVVTITQLCEIKQEVLVNKMFINTPKYLISSVVMFAVVFWLNQRLEFNIFTFALEILVGIVIYASLIMLFKPTIINTIKVYLHN